MALVALLLEHEVSVGPVSFFLVFALVSATSWLGSRLKVRRISDLMKDVSGALPVDAAPENTAPSRGQALQFQLLDGETTLSEAESYRSQFATRAARKILWRVIGLDLALCVVYTLVIAVAGADVTAMLPLLFLCMGSLFGFGLAFLSTSIAFHKKSGITTAMRWVSFFTGVPLFRALRSFTPDFRIYVQGGLAVCFAVAGLTLARGPSRLLGVTVFLLGLLHACIIWFLPAALPRQPNRRLLLLRVFGFNDNSAFTFNGIIDYWNRYGNYYTIADVSLLRTGTVMRGREVVKVLWPMLLGALASAFCETPLILVMFLGVIMTGAAAYLWYEVRSADRCFLRSWQHLESRINKLRRRPCGFNLTFHALALHCFDDMWQGVVRRLLRESDVVLMDLRQFSPERVGCRYEIDLLFRTMPLDRVVFLARARNAAFVLDSLAEHWRQCPDFHKESAEMASPKAWVYVSSAEGDSEVHRLLDLLVALADGVVDEALRRPLLREKRRSEAVA